MNNYSSSALAAPLLCFAVTFDDRYGVPYFPEQFHPGTGARFREQIADMGLYGLQAYSQYFTDLPVGFSMRHYLHDFFFPLCQQYSVGERGFNQRHIVEDKIKARLFALPDGKTGKDHQPVRIPQGAALIRQGIISFIDKFAVVLANGLKMLIKVGAFAGENRLRFFVLI
ncbi:MAG TPA: hypothetical protein VN521_03355 [Negativicutes bacterium]|nr:hypothetical protein [Negativicutes bacterium]